MKHRHLDTETERNVAELLHILIIDGIARCTHWTIKDLVFQGGTSLALAWHSPRFSEDLDFVAADNLNLSEEMRKIAHYVQAGLLPHYPSVELNLKDRVHPDKQNGVFNFDAILPGVIGHIRVKAEFWQVNPEKVHNYQGIYTQMDGRCSIKPMFAVATPEQLFVDKLTAIAHRGRIKWRDLFDLWFLKTQQTQRIEQKFSDPHYFVKMMEVCAKLYNKSASDAINGLREFAQHNTNTLVERARIDLKPWLPEHMWQHFWPSTVREIAELAQAECNRAAELINDYTADSQNPE